MQREESVLKVLRAVERQATGGAVEEYAAEGICVLRI